jgi:beta-galactosidase
MMKNLLTLLVLLVAMFAALNVNALNTEKAIEGTWNYTAEHAPYDYQKGQMVFFEEERETRVKIVIGEHSMAAQGLSIDGENVEFVVFVESEPVFFELKMNGKKMTGKVDSPEGEMPIELVRAQTDESNGEIMTVKVVSPEGEMPVELVKPQTNESNKSIYLNEAFENTGVDFQKTGKGECFIDAGTLISRNAYASFGNADWQNYRISFDANVPETEEQVQIWAGFREQNRSERYVVGLKGGLQNDLVLARLGSMGNDEFLGVRGLDFSPVQGQEYRFSIEVCKNRIRVFLNNEALPRIDVKDLNAHVLPSGKITLGGSWIQTAFDNLEIAHLPENYLDSVPVQEYATEVSKHEKEEKRKNQRSSYEPIKVSTLKSSRTETSLDGNWLFKPGYEVNHPEIATSPDADDADWHIMNVPDFWNPIRIWLHGEKFEGHPKGVSDTYYQNETKRCEAYTFDYKNTKTAWYRQWIELPASIEGKHLELSFDAVSKVGEVYINGTPAGSHIGMFGAFNVDGTDLFKPGKNLVTIKVLRDYVEHIEHADELTDIAVTVEVTNSMLKDLAHGFYNDSPAGIWQPVKLIITDPLRIEDVFIKPNLTGADFEVTVMNTGTKKSTFNMTTTIEEAENKHKLFSAESLNALVLEAGETKTFTYPVGHLQPKLWSPHRPNLYDFSFTLTDEKEKRMYDTKIIRSGFRTFEAKGDYFYLNGHRYWLRGANHTPFALAPNDTALADRTYQLYKEANIEVTRTHTTPYNKVWMEAADRNGFGISFEGTWPWLMIKNSMPKEELLKLWEHEWYDVIKKYRNHPSLFMWTVNNEMKFYENESSVEAAKQKMEIISDVVKHMREIDPTRPISFDSGYVRDEKKFGKAFLDAIDDGDMDDRHWYVNWYHGSLFDEFNGQLQKKNKNEGRPLISQEMSTGYPNNETGHPTRSYTFQHQTPQSLVGSYSYPFADPKYFLESHSFITAELAEALRRSNDKMAGVLHFASITWFRNVYDAQTVEPYPVYYRMKNAMQPVLVSAELYGRHFYAGEKIPARICVVNDQHDGERLEPSILKWKICDQENRVIGSGEHHVPAVGHYKRAWITPEIFVPAHLKSNRINGKLKLSLEQNNKQISTNEYQLVFASKDWATSESIKEIEIALVDFNDQTGKVLDFVEVPYTSAESVHALFDTKADVYVISGLEKHKNFGSEEATLIREKIKAGNKVLLLNSGSKSKNVFPEYIKGFLESQHGEIVNMEVPESNVFDELEYLDLRYFNNNKAEMPRVCSGVIRLKESEKITPLASQARIHGYLRGDLKKRNRLMGYMKGYPVVRIEDGGRVILSEITTAKGLYDPIATRLLMNMINDLMD